MGRTLRFRSHYLGAARRLRRGRVVVSLNMMACGDYHSNKAFHKDNTLPAGAAYHSDNACGSCPLPGRPKLKQGLLSFKIFL